ncbi:MAG: MltA domain-containing protein [Alphaproteobacteria bacterium]|nr:MltA domain-containing protein [Alphaproteobacteria bacterium]
MAIVFRASALLGAIVLTSCAVGRFAGEPGASGGRAVGLAPASFAQLPGWNSDRVADAVPAFVKSCERAAQRRSDAGPLDPAAPNPDFGALRDWRPLCREAAALPRGDERTARRFFEANFVPALIGDPGCGAALFTGYWEAELNGSKTREARYQTPVYRRPPDLVDGQPYLDRGAIEDGALAGKGLEAVWLEDPDDLFVLQMQGSGRVRLTDGSIMRLTYAGNNSRPFVDISALLRDQGAIPKAQFSEKAVRAWMRAHSREAKELRRKDPLYVFFEERHGDGPVGYQGAVLTAERSLAVDHRYIPLGAPLWLDAHDRYRPVAVQRLVVAQDTGDGITGPLRGDFYWGSGKQAAARGSDFYADGRYWVLLPRNVAIRLVAARD